MKKASCHQNFKGVIKSEKSLKQVLLGPKPTVLQDPALWIFSGEKNVMAMHEHAFFQPRQNLEILVHDVAASLHDVALVDEKNVVSFQRTESFYRDRLHFFFKHFR